MLLVYVPFCIAVFIIYAYTYAYSSSNPSHLQSTYGPVILHIFGWAWNGESLSIDPSIHLSGRLYLLLADGLSIGLNENFYKYLLEEKS